MLRTSARIEDVAGVSDGNGVQRQGAAGAVDHLDAVAPSQRRLQDKTRVCRIL